jgi:CspA family cold shock protein
MRGTVKFFNPERGFGFLIPDGGGSDVFFHVTALRDVMEPKVGDRLAFDIETGHPKGDQAVRVKRDA